MTYIGAEITVYCSHCNQPFRYSLECSRATKYMRDAQRSGTLLCEKCVAEKAQSKHNFETRVEKLWTPRSLDFSVFKGPNAELYEYLDSHPEGIYTISSRAFEELLADILQNHGFTVELTPITRDGGIDIVACHKDTLSTQCLYLIECKHYTPPHKVGFPVVQRLLGVTYSQEATKGILVTSSFFTLDAKRLEKKHQYRLSLIDYEVLKTWIRDIRRRFSNGA